MDPVSALGLAASVVQCVQFTSSLLKGTHNIYSSSHGLSAQSQELDRIYRQLSGFSSDLAKRSNVPSRLGVPPSGHEASLQELATSCRAACDELLSVVAQLRAGTSPQRFWKSFAKALKEVMRQDDLRRLQERIGRMELSMVLHISAVSCENIERLQLEVQRLISRSQQLGCSHEIDLQRIRADISQILQKLNRGKGRRGSDDSDGVDAGILTTKLAKLSLESRTISTTQDILASLDYSQRSLRHESIHEAHARTYSWALQGSEPEEVVSSRKGQGNLFRWLSSKHGIFWVSGKPGSGKSTFMKFIADHAETRRALSQWASPHEVIIASHYFWSAGTPIQRSLQGLWQSLLFEILSKEPDTIPEICKDRWDERIKLAHPKQTPSQSAWGSSELRDCFSRLAQLKSTRSRFCVFIDGLDEFDGDHLDIAQTLIKLSQLPTVKLCVSSRPWNEFETSLGHSPTSKIYMHELTRDDVLRFSENQLAQHPRWATEVDSAGAESLINGIADRAQGVFLWVVLVTKLLRGGLTNDDTPEDLHNMLYSMHPDLEQFFKQILDGVSPVYHTKMAGFLEISLAAEQPLDAHIYHFHELEYGDVDFAMKEPISAHDEQEIQSLHNRVQHRLDALCKGLLEIGDGGEIQFIHRTVHDWLETEAMRADLKAKLKADFSPRLSILRAYLAWLKHPEVGSEIVYGGDNKNLGWRGHLIIQLEEALEYACLTEELDEARMIDELYQILDEFSSVVDGLVRAGLITLASDNNIKIDADYQSVLLRCIFFETGPWGYLAYKAREFPDYFRPLVKHPDTLRFQDHEWPPTSSEDELRCVVATCLLELIIDEYFPGEIYKIDGGPLDADVYERLERIWYMDLPAGAVRAGADINIIWKRAESPPMPIWMVLIILAFKMNSPRINKELGRLELFYGAWTPILTTSSETEIALWNILCSHISALRGSSNTYNSTPQKILSMEPEENPVEPLFWVLDMVIFKLLKTRDCNQIPLKNLMTAVNEGIPPYLAAQFSETLEELDLSPKVGPVRDVEIADVVGPAAPQAILPGGSRKRGPAELLACERVKRARRHSF